MPENPDSLVSCPFDSSHRLVRTRLPQHIVKCKKNYRGVPMQRCEFNGTHYFKQGMLSEHLATCRDYHESRREEYEKYPANKDDLLD